MYLLIGVLFVLSAQDPSRPPRQPAPQRPDAAALSGRVTEHGSDRPLPRIVVQLDAPPSSRTYRTITDEHGRYEFTQIPPGEYALSAGPDAHHSTHLRQRFGESLPTPRFGALAGRPNITLKPREVRTSADLTLMRSLAIEGRVLDPSDEPMARVELSVKTADGRSVATYGGYSDDLGFYRVYGLAPGRYRVCARIEGSGEPNGPSAEALRLVHTCHLAAVQDAHASDILLTTADATGIDIRVQRLGTHAITGRVLDASGAPADGAHVSATGDLEGVNAWAKSIEGSFTLKGLLPGRYLLRASLGGAPPGDPNPPSRELEAGYADVEVIGADVGGVSLMLSKPTAVSGRVRYTGGRPPSPRELRMVVHATPGELGRDSFERPPQSVVDDNLQFELKDLYSRSLVLRVQGIPDGWAVRAITLGDRNILHLPTDLTADAATGLTIELTDRVAQPTVRVADDSDPTATTHHVVVGPADPAKWRHGFTALPVGGTADRVIRIGSLSPGDYLVAAVRSDEVYLLWRDPLRADALRGVATPVSLSAGDRPVIDLRVVRLPRRGDR
jgi:hypothetical protein